MSTLFRVPTLRQELAFTLRLGPPTSTDLTSDQGWPTRGDPGFGLQLGRLAMGRVLGRFPRLPAFLCQRPRAAGAAATSRCLQWGSLPRARITPPVLSLPAASIVPVCGT